MEWSCLRPVAPAFGRDRDKRFAAVVLRGNVPRTGATATAEEGTVATAEEAVKDVDVIVTVTPANKPVLKSEWISDGTHINAMGADAPGKQELESGLLKKSKIFIY